MYEQPHEQTEPPESQNTHNPTPQQGTREPTEQQEASQKSAAKQAFSQSRNSPTIHFSTAAVVPAQGGGEAIKLPT
jgi:hypothetical protein